MAIDPEPVHAGLLDEDSEVPLLSRSHRIKGPVLITMEARLTEVTRRQTSIEEPISISIEVALSSSFQGQGMSVDPIGIHPRSSVGIIPPVEVPELSSIDGLIGAELLTIGILPTPVSSSSSSEKLDYSRDDDID